MHRIVDNYCTHKEAHVTKWLARRPRFHVHFTPTSSSWLNLVERFFGELTEDVIRDGSFCSVRLLARTLWRRAVLPQTVRDEPARLSLPQTQKTALPAGSFSTWLDTEYPANTVYVAQCIVPQ